MIINNYNKFDCFQNLRKGEVFSIGNGSTTLHCLKIEPFQLKEGQYTAVDLISGEFLFVSGAQIVICHPNATLNLKREN